MNLFLPIRPGLEPFSLDRYPDRRRSNISSRNAADKLKPVIFGFGLPGYENGIHLMLW
jgi:hypothetical protein